MAQLKGALDACEISVKELESDIGELEKFIQFQLLPDHASHNLHVDVSVLAFLVLELVKW